MSVMYQPEGWMLLSSKAEDNTTDVFVFGSWGDGRDERWRRNSGITKVEEDNEHYYFYGYSGSCYKCAKGAYGKLTPYNHAVYIGMLGRSDQVSEFDVKQLGDHFTISKHGENVES